MVLSFLGNFLLLTVYHGGVVMKCNNLPKSAIYYVTYLHEASQCELVFSLFALISSQTF